MTLAQFFAHLPVRDTRVKQSALTELETALQKCQVSPDGAQARKAVETLMSRCTCTLSYDEAVARHRSVRPTGQDWDVFVARRTLAMTLFPFAARKVQRTYRKRLLIRKAVLVIQRAALEHLYKPRDSWGFQRSLDGAFSVLEP